MSEIDSVVKEPNGNLKYRCLPCPCPTELVDVFGASGISLEGYLRAPKG